MFGWFKKQAPPTVSIIHNVNIGGEVVDLITTTEALTSARIERIRAEMDRTVRSGQRFSLR